MMLEDKRLAKNSTTIAQLEFEQQPWQKNAAIKQQQGGSRNMDTTGSKVAHGF